MAEKGKGSWIWSKILKLRDLATSFTHWEIKDGNAASFWYDEWSSLGRLVDISGTRGARDLEFP